MTLEELRPIINRHFLIRIRFIQEPEDEVRLVGAGQYFKYVGKELAQKHFKKALTDGVDICTFRMRGRRRIEFVSK